MKTSSFCVTPFALLLILLAFGSALTAPSAVAQVSFFTPPGYVDGYPLFTADFNRDGKPDVLSATNGGNGPSGVMNLGNGDGTFSMGTPVSGLPLAVADFNGDGIPDVLEQGTGTLLVLLGNGDGTFQAPISTASGANLTNIAAADLNGDGKADVVGIFNGALLVYMGKGNGTFSPGVSYSLGTTGSANVTFGDFNGDNITDIAVVINNIDLPGSVLVFLGNGDGTFQSPKTSPAMYSAGFAAAGDFNGDGKLDLVASGSTAPANNSALGVFLLLGNGDGTFQAPTEIIPVGAEVAAADVNGDGKLDLILEGGAAQIYLGNGDGTFYLASSYVLGWTSTAGDQNSRSIRKPGTIPTPGSIVIADFNLDGKPDIATGGSDLLGNGDGTFQGIWLGLATYAQSTLGPEVVGDFEKKGAQDVAQLSSAQSGNTLVYTLYILSNNGAGTLSLIHTYTLPGPANDIVTADFNGDGNLDLVVAGSLGFSSGNWSYTVLLGNGDGSFQTPVFYQQNVASVIGPRSITVADFNKDHYLDLVIGAGNQSLAVLLGKGDGTFSAPDYLFDNYDGFETQVVLSADFNGDGNPDIAAGVASTGTALLLGNGDGTFQPAVFPSNLSGFLPLFIADVNLDGKPDLLSNGEEALGNGDGTFTVLTLNLGYNTLMGVADFNGDGIPDLFEDNYNNGFEATQSYVVLGKGDGTFGAVINVPPNGIVPPNAVFADMNGDGLNDIVFPYGEANQGSLPLGSGLLINTTHVGPPVPDFHMLASEFSPTPVVAGNSTTSTVAITSLHGFTGTINLSCKSLPSGASCSFNPPAIANGSGSSTLTLTTATSVQPGNYVMAVYGASGILAHIAALNLTVAPGLPDFQISASPASPSTVVAEGSATSTVTVTSLNGFNSAVALACSTGVPGITCSLNFNSVTPSSTFKPTSTLTINTTTAVASGAYTITVTGTSGSIQHGTGVVLTVQAATNFTIGSASGSQTSATVTAGTSAMFKLDVTSPTWSGTVNLACGVSPSVTPAPTCTLPSSVNVTAGKPATITITLATTAPVTTGTIAWPGFPPDGLRLASTVLLFASGILFVGTRKRLPRLAAPLIFLGLISLGGCGGSSSPPQTTPGTPAGTYTVTVNATAGSVKQSMPLTVVVQ